jgi:hypothetical protein
MPIAAPVTIATLPSSVPVAISLSSDSPELTSNHPTPMRNGGEH